MNQFSDISMIHIIIGVFGLVVLVIAFSKSSSVGDYQKNKDITIHPPLTEESEIYDESAEDITQTQEPPQTEIGTRARFYENKKKEEHLQEKQKSLQELQEEIEKKAQEDQSKINQQKEDLKNRDFYQKQRERILRNKQ